MDRNVTHTDYIPPRNGDKTISAIIDLLFELDRRHYDMHCEVIDRIDDLRDDFIERMEACRKIERERTQQAVEYVARRVTEGNIRRNMTSSAKTILWAIGILGGIVLSTLAIILK